MSAENAGRMALRDRNRLRVRADILDAVAEALSELGYAGATLDEIRARAGVSRATLYTYFPGGRDEMVQQAYVRIADEVYVRGFRLRADADDIPGRITALATALVEVAATPTGRFYGVMGPDVASVVSDVSGSTSRPFESLIREDLVEARDAGRLRGSAPVDSLASCLTGALRAAAASTARRPASSEENIAAIAALAGALLDD